MNINWSNKLFMSHDLEDIEQHKNTDLEFYLPRHH